MDSPFPKAEETCYACAPRWNTKKEENQILVALPVTTENYSHEIAVCPYCDGEPIIEISQYNYGESDDLGDQTQDL